MLVFKKRHELENYIADLKPSGIGFVPTMGALHKGHLSLIETSMQRCALTVSSIYINPTQFNSLADYEKYPYTPDKDIALLDAAGCQVLYLPDTEDVYGKTLPVNEHYDIGYIEDILEGAFRPGHYQGVCMVVRRLIEAVMPDTLFLGLKDYQQVMVLRRLVDLQKMKVTIVGCPTLREDNGLAMSSRNLRLSAAQHQTAAILYKTLQLAAKQYTFDTLDAMCQYATDSINSVEGMRTEYFDIRNADTLQEIHHADEPAIALVAAFCGDVRLIDNLRVN